MTSVLHEKTLAGIRARPFAWLGVIRYQRSSSQHLSLRRDEAHHIVPILQK